MSDEDCETAVEICIKIWLGESLIATVHFANPGYKWFCDSLQSQKPEP